MSIGDGREAELRARIAELEAAIEARDEFIAVVGHELRNPVSPVYVQVSHLIRMLESAGDVAPTQPTIDKLHKISRNVRRFLSVLDRIADVSRIRAGKLDLRTEPVELGALVRDIAARFRSELAAAGSTLSIGTQTVQGEWDPMRLEQIVSNLLSNAIRYGAGQPIAVEVQASEHLAAIIVRDHGSGIAPEDLERIFSRFERGRTTPHRGGFGIGLWVVKRVLEAMGGAIEVETAVGQGSTFRVTLPLRVPSTTHD